MLRNNQMSLIVLLIIIGVTLYLLSCDNSDKPLKNLGDLEVSSLNAQGNQIVNEVDDAVLNEIVQGNDNAEESEMEESEMHAEAHSETHSEMHDEMHSEFSEEEHVHHAEHPVHMHKKKHTKKHDRKSSKQSELDLDKYFDNCAINGGNLYNENDFSAAPSDSQGASVNVAYKPSPLNPNTCTDCIDFNGTSDNPNTKYKAENYLPQETNNTWFETDFSNAKYDVKNNKLINTDKFAIGINTVGQSLKNPSYDIRGTIPCPKITVSPWMQSTIEPDFNIASLY